MSGCQIRPAVPSDGQCVAVIAAALSAHEGEPPPPFDADSFRRYGFAAANFELAGDALAAIANTVSGTG